MAIVINNPTGRRMIRLSTDDVLSVVSMYQQKCNCKSFTHEEIRQILTSADLYLPEDFN